MDPAFMTLLSVFPQFRDFLSSTFGGQIINQWSAQQQKQAMDEFRATLDEVNARSWDMLTQTVGLAGAEGPWRIRPEVRPDAHIRTELQRRIDAGEPLGRLERYAERTPTAIAGAFELEEEGRRLGKEYFDPHAATERFTEALAPAVAGLEALPGQVARASGRVQKLYGGVQAELRTGAADVAGGYAALGEELQRGAAGIAGGYQDLLGRARGLVSTLGGQERRDITRQFTEAESEAQMGLSARGLGGSTISSSIGAGFGRERTEALGRLQDRLTTQQLGVEETFGLSGLGARERLFGARINLGAAGLGAAERFVGAGANVGAQQATAMQFGNQLYAGTAAGTLAARGNIAAGRVGEFNQAAINRLSNLFNFGQVPIQTQMQGAGFGLGWTGPYTAVMPAQYQSANVYSYGG